MSNSPIEKSIEHAAGLVAELRTPGGRFIRREQIENNRTTIGRGFHNDIVVDDPFVCIKHLEIERDANGEYFVNDLNSKNGTWEHKTQKAINRRAVGEFLTLRIGETQLRLFPENHPREDTEEYCFSKRLHISWLRCLLFVFATLFILFARMHYLGHHENRNEDLITHLGIALAFVLLLQLPWAGFWAVIGGISRGRANFFTHFTIACSWMIFGYFTSGLHTVLAYNTYTGSGLFFSSALWLLFTGGGLYVHLRAATRMSKSRARLISGSIIVIILAITGLSYGYVYWGFSSKPKLSTKLHIPTLKFKQPVSVDDFLSHTDELGEKLELDKHSLP